MRFNKDKIIADLKGLDTEIRLSALEIIRTNKEKSFAPYIIELLGDSEWRVRESAILTLLDMGVDEALIDGLVSLLGSEDNAGNRNSAMEVLIGMGKDAVLPLMSRIRDASDDVKKFIIDVLGEIGDNKCIKIIIAGLRADNENIKMSAIEALGKIKDRRGVEPLVELLRSDNQLIVFAAIKSLEQIGDSRAVEPIISLLGKSFLEKAALEALGKLGDIRALNPTVSALNTGSKKIKDPAIKTLVELHNRSSYTAGIRIVHRVKEIYNKEIFLYLVSALGDKDEGTRLAAIKIFGWLGEYKSAKELADFLDTELKEEAMHTLSTIGRKAIRPLLEKLPNSNAQIREGIARIFGEIGDRNAVASLIGMISDENGHVRQQAAVALGKIKDRSCSRPLTRLLGDEYANVQDAAVEAISTINDKSIIPLLLELLESQKSTIRCNAVRLLGRLGASEAMDKLSLALKDEDQNIRKTAIEAIGFLHGPGVEHALLLALTDETPSVRLSTLGIIIKRRDLDLIDHIIPLISDGDIWVRAAMARGLGERLGKEAKKLLLDLLRDKVGVVQIAALETLAKIKDREAIPEIKKLLKSSDADVIKVAIATLGDLGDAEAGATITPYLDNRDWRLRVAAAKTLGKIRYGPAIERLKKMAKEDLDNLVRQSAQFAVEQITR